MVRHAFFRAMDNGSSSPTQHPCRYTGRITGRREEMVEGTYRMRTSDAALLERWTGRRDAQAFTQIVARARAPGVWHIDAHSGLTNGISSPNRLCSHRSAPIHGWLSTSRKPSG